MSQFAPSDELISLFASSRPNQSGPTEYYWFRHKTISSFMSFRPDVSTSSSFGLIDLLPTELLIQVTNSLDLQSLDRLSRVSIRGYSTIHRLPAYQALLRHAPAILPAFGATGIARRFTLPEVYQALKSDRCIWCMYFGGYLFLPTCERACLGCLNTKSYFRLLWRHEARISFRITDSEWFLLPKTTLFFETRDINDVGRVSTPHLLDFWNRNHPDELLDWESMSERMRGNGLYEHYVPADVVYKAIRIPFLSKDDEVEPGFECRKCREMNNVDDFDWNLAHLYTRSELWEHCKICFGQPRLFEILEREERDRSEEDFVKQERLCS